MSTDAEEEEEEGTSEARQRLKQSLARSPAWVNLVIIALAQSLPVPGRFVYTPCTETIFSRRFTGGSAKVKGVHDVVQSM
jgi:hypothetical protein